MSQVTCVPENPIKMDELEVPLFLETPIRIPFSLKGRMKKLPKDQGVEQGPLHLV